MKKAQTTPELEKANRLEPLYTLFFYLSILLFLIGFNFADNPMQSGWYQQFMPNINGASVRDITFTDSLNGYAVTSIGGSNSYILKTTNGGDNWTVKFLHNQPFVRVIFINNNTGFTNAFTTIFKTTNAGENWNAINLPGIFGDDMFVLNEDTIWLAMSESLVGGVFRTINGGASWDRQASFSPNPSRIYMFNRNIGFVSAATGQILRMTINGGFNWTTLSSAGAFTDMFFADSLTGWKSGAPGGPGFRKTTDGGYNWFDQTMPQGGTIVASQIERFDNINRDTIWGVGGWVQYPNFQSRGMIYRTINGGDNWLFQVPDTSINIVRYSYTSFINKQIGWAYSSSPGVHTTTGGDDTFYTPVKQISSNIPKDFKLYQNYPNPFNSSSKIKFQIPARSAGGSKTSEVSLKVFDITGRFINTLVSEKLQAGEYETTFNAVNLSTGVYFYSLIIDGIIVETKRMILLK